MQVISVMHPPAILMAISEVELGVESCYSPLGHIPGKFLVKNFTMLCRPTSTLYVSAYT